jgi:hypothetical protein
MANTNSECSNTTQSYNTVSPPTISTTINPDEDSTMAAASSGAVAHASVWVQLCYKGEQEAISEPIKIEPIPEDIADLKEKVIEEAKTVLGVQVYNLKVYAPETSTVPIPKHTESVDPGKDVPADTTRKKPLIVIAPKQPNGKSRYCFPIVVRKLLRE